MKYKQIFIGILICIVLEFVLYQINHKYNIVGPFFSAKKESPYEKRQGGGQFTNPLLECMGIEETDSTGTLHVSEPKLEEFVNKVTASHNLSIMSVYLRDLNNGPWIGMNEDINFVGGSLLKVPMLISYLKLAESDPTLLSKTINYPEQIIANQQYYAPSNQIVPGNSYTVDELLRYMIVYSDNNAAQLLLDNIDIKEFDELFVALGLGDPDPNKPYPVNTKTYAAFFRVLFNASYLSKGYSEKALKLLSEIEFNRGLQSMLPSDVVVSHKFGIRSDDDINQLHDCGIVYHTKNPYLICIMSRGGKYDDMAASIAEVSKFVYDQVSSSK